eukprot:3503423-Rhodomonas_salina.2
MVEVVVVGVGGGVVGSNWRLLGLRRCLPARTRSQRQRRVPAVSVGVKRMSVVMPVTTMVMVVVMMMLMMMIAMHEFTIEHDPQSHAPPPHQNRRERVRKAVTEEEEEAVREELIEPCAAWVLVDAALPEVCARHPPHPTALSHVDDLHPLHHHHHHHHHHITTSSHHHRHHQRHHDQQHLHHHRHYHHHQLEYRSVGRSVGWEAVERFKVYVCALSPSNGP